MKTTAKSNDILQRVREIQNKVNERAAQAPKTPLIPPHIKPTIQEGQEKKSRKKCEQRVVWTEEEWDRLADLCGPIYRKKFDLSLTQIVNRVMAQFPENRRRKIGALMHLTELTTRLERRMQEAEDALEEVTSLHQRLETLPEVPTRDDILSQLTTEEIVQRFGKTVLENVSLNEITEKFDVESLVSQVGLPKLIGITAEKLAENLGGQSGSVFDLISKLITKPTPVPQVANTYTPVIQSKPKTTKPRFVVAGPLPQQQRIIEEKVGDLASLVFLDKDRVVPDSFPTNADIIFVWKNFVSHSINDQARLAAKKNNCQMILVKGGVNNVVGAILSQIK